MDSTLLGIILGAVFGIAAIVPMFKMNFPDKNAAIVGALINRFAIGFLIPNALPDVDPILRGLLLGILLSLPDAIITKAYAPIMGLGIIGSLVIGLITRLVGAA
ncbi:MAG: hypothetical protein H6672_10645 [Anaerolineaceae bacterium]|nr:hypothetical protein [Anaerolineaceae bacterium]